MNDFLIVSLDFYYKYLKKTTERGQENFVLFNKVLLFIYFSKRHVRISNGRNGASTSIAGVNGSNTFVKQVAGCVSL